MFEFVYAGRVQTCAARAAAAADTAAVAAVALPGRVDQREVGRGALGEEAALFEAEATHDAAIHRDEPARRVNE